MSGLYLMKGVLTHGGPSWAALIREGDSTVPDVLAIDYKGVDIINGVLWSDIIKIWIERGKSFNTKVRVPEHDLPLYISWPYKSSAFMTLFKRSYYD